MSFGEAITAMQSGNKVARSGWNGKGMWLALAVGGGFARLFDEASVEMSPFIVMKTAQGNCIPWLASQADVLVTDWELVKVW